MYKGRTIVAALCDASAPVVLNVGKELSPRAANSNCQCVEANSRRHTQSGVKRIRHKVPGGHHRV